MAKKSYTEALEELTKAVEESSAFSDSHVLEIIREDVKEIKCELLKQNSSIRENRDAMLQIAQWREDHVELSHGAIDKIQSEINARVNRWIVGNLSLSALLTAAVVTFKEGFSEIKNLLLP